MYRIGIGWDRHRLAKGRVCVLGGVRFPESEAGPVGHSDGDGVCHSVSDALLGAAALGDIGRHFPDTDPIWEGADSLDLLARVVGMVRAAGFQVVNVDCTLVTEKPRIMPRAEEMAAVLAAVLEVEPDAVSIKATTGEGLGPEGRGECMTAMAVALLRRA